MGSGNTWRRRRADAATSARGPTGHVWAGARPSGPPLGPALAISPLYDRTPGGQPRGGRPGLSRAATTAGGGRDGEPGPGKGDKRLALDPPVFCRTPGGARPLQFPPNQLTHSHRLSSPQRATLTGVTSSNSHAGSEVQRRCGQTASGIRWRRLSTRTASFTLCRRGPAEREPCLYGYNAWAGYQSLMDVFFGHCGLDGWGRRSA